MDKELTSIGTTNGVIVSKKYRCTKPGCNCAGSWVVGDDNPKTWEDLFFDRIEDQNKDED